MEQQNLGQEATQVSLVEGEIKVDRPHPSRNRTLFTSGGFTFLHATAPVGDFNGINVNNFFSYTMTVGSLGHLDWDIGDGKRHGNSIEDGEQFLWLANQPTYACMTTPLECLALMLDPSFLSHAAQETIDPDHIEVLGQSQRRDPLVAGIGHTLYQQHTQHGVIDTLYGETLATALAVHLLRTYTTRKPVIAALTPRGLGPSDLRRAAAYIMDNLDGSLSLADIAASVHLSPYHFARLFKLSTGTSVHQYVLAQRLEKAKSLLRHGRLSVSEVAHAVGFYDHAHFIRHFKRSVGVTPKTYRAG